jgi:hypothetical protein
MRAFVMSITLVAGLIVLATGGVQAESISETITTTRTLTQDTDLGGDVTCTVSGAPCLVFGAPVIQLRLNGRTITGPRIPDACPTVALGEDGIRTNGQPGVAIVGPGLIRRFREHEILVNGNHSAVRQVVVASSCLDRIAVFGRDNRVEQNTVVWAATAGTACDIMRWYEEAALASL